MEGLESGWVVLAQVGAESVDHLGLVPDRVLMSASQHGDGLDGFAVDGQRPVGGYVGARILARTRASAASDLARATLLRSR
jgi:hypothetical protein